MNETKLFKVTILRLFTPEHKKKWHTTDETFSHWEWGATARGITALWEIKHNEPSYWDKMYTDILTSVVEEDPAPLRQKVAESKYTACCSLAIFRNCVCSWSTSCPVHGTACHGTHD